MPDAGMVPTPAVPRARKPPSVSNEKVEGIVVPPLVGAGRALPPVLALKAKVPLLPALSVHEPPRPASVMRASICTPRPPGTVTTCRPKPIVPSGFGVPRPTSGARWGAPHWSS